LFAQELAQTLFALNVGLTLFGFVIVEAFAALCFFALRLSFWRVQYTSQHQKRSKDF
jgi:hypothetical protein